ncbi:LytTR family DNA-binding domain-containing protein [Geothrix sp. PMB-07]|uniref:LytR/AlgR family response regulator transcription factor n=1 Tax=Geothrix sp. PMB-07 TaxID=3068640 RepID=UPI002740B7FE|nr:LytTR family DNA-binding domain-containing protein [Geothrix sp. PMB-07]WLT33473.1 LytTR family DNA-binding domain-containing protein [Geothrix sp. PMB-07]
MCLKVALVDDESWGRERLASLLRDLDCEVIAELDHGLALLSWLKSGPAVDCLFLDVDMPGVNGLDVWAALVQPPPVVFISAHSGHAFRAFECEALDYLLKPVMLPRLQQTITRLNRIKAGMPGALQVLSKDEPTRSKGDRFPVRAGKGQLLLETRRVILFEVEDETVWAWCGGERFRTFWKSLSEVEAELPMSGFAKIHRGALLRLSAVVGVRPLPSGRCRARLNDGTEMDVSRVMTPTFKAALGAR